MITSVGMWVVPTAYSPLAAHYRVPVSVLVGAVESRPVVRAGSVVARPMLTLTATFDHRYVDALQAAQFAAAVRDYCAHPAVFEPVDVSSTATACTTCSTEAATAGESPTPNPRSAASTA
jgi:hypothetical protein